MRKEVALRGTKRIEPATFIAGSGGFIELFESTCYWIVSVDPLKPCIACLATHFNTRLVS